ncbi:hypothetical protein HYQ46_012486 [Verticillium longisporum]|nr:hypothetical protein HYQ46_012486 [Verticillium longisporum]
MGQPPAAILARSSDVNAINDFEAIKDHSLEDMATGQDNGATIGRGIDAVDGMRRTRDANAGARRVGRVVGRDLSEELSHDLVIAAIHGGRVAGTHPLASPSCRSVLLMAG